MWIVTLAVGCGRYRPALFAEGPVVTVANDDKPIEVPAVRSFNEKEQVSDVYIRRPLFDVVRPTDFPTGGDVNAMDEVPPSSWYDPGLGDFQPAPPDQSPPELPLTEIDDDPATSDDAIVVKDARGHRYELLGDPTKQPGLHTAADVLGGHLLRGFGLYAPKAWIVNLPEDSLKGESERMRAFRARGAVSEHVRRVSATRWPPGIDLGVTSDYNTRRDDPNDLIPHRNRRTLRALRLFAHWIGWGEFGVQRTRDVYVGKPNQGHVVHYVFGTGDAFGIGDIQAHPQSEALGGGFWFNLVTLGLSPVKIAGPRDAPLPSLGYLPATLVPGEFTVSPPYSPFVRFTPADEYWAAKRLIDGSERALVAGVEAAQLPKDAAAILLEELRGRRRLLITHALSVVTPLDVAAVVGRTVWVRDRAISTGLALPKDTEYEIAFLDSEGHTLSPTVTVKPTATLTEINVPTLVSGLVVFHVRASRSGVAAPNACDIHLMTNTTSARLIGVRH